MTEPGYHCGIHDPEGRLASNDVAVRNSAILDSIAAKQAHMPKVNANGHPIPDPPADHDQDDADRDEEDHAPTAARRQRADSGGSAYVARKW